MNKIKKIPLWIYTEEVNIKIRIYRKQKLTELYPQRAIIEEDRKRSQLIQANDWIDHDYYENMVHESRNNHIKMLEKYSPRVPKGRISTNPPKWKPVKPLEEY